MTIEINIQLFGSARSLYQSPTIHLQMPVGTSLKNLREILSQELGKNSSQGSEILNSSVFATESEILPESSEFFQNTTLALMPPVCGG